MPKIRLQDREDNPGLPAQGEPEFLSIGILHGLHGVRGEMKMEVWTDFPERIKKGKEIFIGEKKEKQIVRSFKQVNHGFLIAFEGYEIPEDIRLLLKKKVYISTKQLPRLEENTYYYHQVIGMDVFSVDEVRLGKIVEIISTGSNDVYVIKGEDQNRPEILIPAISSVIVKVDLDDKKMIINPPEWG